MSEFFTLLLREAESGWVWMYTAGMPDESRQGRVAELESDAWEHQALAAERHERFGLQFLHRMVRGMSADIGWRVAQGRPGFESRNWLEVVIAMLIAVGIFVGLPASGFLMPYAGISNNGTPLSLLVATDALLVTLALVLPGILVIERWPVAGAVLVMVGCLCLTALFWWLRELMAVISLGMVAALVGSIRLRRLRRRQ